MVANTKLMMAPPSTLTSASRPTAISISSARATTPLPLLRPLLLLIALVLVSLPTSLMAFNTPLSSSSSSIHKSTFHSIGCATRRQQQRRHQPSPSIFRPFPQRRQRRHTTSSSTTSLNLLGSDSGLLGVGAPEVAVILLVGYFILGPSDLYKLVKEIGKFIQNARTLGAEAAKSFEGTMEDQLELTELRRAQSELNSAFGFRRSINTSEFGEAFDRSGFGEALDGSGAGVAATAVAGSSGSNTSTGSIMTEVGEEEEEDSTPKRKRRLVRRKKKKVVVEEDIPSLSEGEYDTKDFALEYPDLDMLDSVVEDENNDLRAQRMERLQSSATTSATTRSNEKEEIMDWFTSSEEDIAATILNQPTSVDNATSSYEKQRFQTQLSADEWNAQIMAREDELSPLSMVMQRLAILDEEKRAADKRIEEEYMRRLDNEDKYYLEKRNVLLEAIGDIQEGVYGNDNGGVGVSGGGSNSGGEDEGTSSSERKQDEGEGSGASGDDDDDATASKVEEEEEENATKFIA
ncbi:hypothetical protein ACHAXH_003628 [Discostella pseudostelligera]